MSQDRFPPVPSGYPFPRLEREVLARWKERGTFASSLSRPAPRGTFVLYEGPPTANNAPHVGHVVTRVVKDLYPRYRTMRGYHAPRKAGWDTHGLPVEIEVEKRLGFTGKQQIEAYGIERFNAECLESVHTYERQWRAMTERVGYWTDMDDAYFTYTNEYVESVWWALRELSDKGLLEQGYKIQPYCARCGTTLSSHEVAQNYKETDDPSVWVRFPVRPGQTVRTAEGGELTTEDGLALVAWTTTPWTLLSHVALTVNPALTYKVVDDPTRPGGRLVIADGLEVPVPVMVAGDDGKRREIDLRDSPALARVRGTALAGLRYDRPFRVTDAERWSERRPADYDEAGWQVVTGDYVTATDGTGIVHTAPLYGEDDYATGNRNQLPLIRAVNAQGEVQHLPGVERFAGKWFKDADGEISRDLKERGLLLHQAQYRHNYPFCWRCDRPLLYFGALSWFVRTTERKAELIAENEKVDWHPAHVGEGRFGNWLENVVDWALSRKRYWGTPLPVWECDACPHKQVVGSYRELFDKTGRELPDDVYDRAQFDPHRPFVDRDWAGGERGEAPFTWACTECGRGTMGRVDDVIDAWFDSGSMPFAQYHYPFENEELFRQRFPANLISEAVDQTRGWFYTLHALGTLLFGQRAYEHCIVLGHINDETGRKMSKRLGNVVEPMAVIEETGADAMRWYFCVNNPEVSGRFSARLVREAAQAFLLPLWNALSFFTIYANLDGWEPAAARPGAGGQAADGAAELAGRPALDRWVLLRLDRLVRDTTAHLDGYRTTEAARGIEAFLDDLTNWYIRRSRDRFWRGSEDGGPGGDDPRSAADKASAYAALYEVLTTLARLIAPFTPFVAEVLHRHLVASVRPDAPDSVHLEDWPEPPAVAGGPAREEPELEVAMAAIQRIVRLGHAARNTHGIKTRQPLAAVTLVAADEALPARIAPYEELLRDELNVREVHWAADRSAYVTSEVKPLYPKTGPRFGKQMKEVAAALAAEPGDRRVAELEERGAIRLELSTGPVELTGEEVEVRLTERAGTATQGDRELLVALDTELTADLVAEGRAREVVHHIQTARKEADLAYSDRIRVRYAAAPELAAAVAAHREWIAEQTLAAELVALDGPAGGGELPGDAREAAVEDLALRFTIEKASA
ncbi:MAG TPA: isoleucine--tRNA ligase [Thermoanaerobaculia bacterium]|nr:isoleucine--tRNA ligase [Thermoanaerobaculia bacterium]